MSRVRRFAVRGTAHHCDLCEVLGLSATPTPDQDSPTFAHWLVRAGYGSVVFGCDVSPSDWRTRFPHFAEQGLEPVFCQHQMPDEPGHHWLVRDQLRDLEFSKLNEQTELLWIPRRGDLARELRPVPREITDRLYVIWPHPVFLRTFGWTWSEMLAQQAFLPRAYPYLRHHQPTGWDLFNPEIDADLRLEAEPDYVKDPRPTDFRPEFSVILPTYNNLHPLRSAVEQTLQLRGSFEVLVADDGSNDGTREWLENRADWPAHLVYLRMERPRARRIGGGGFRAGIARNSASVLARGEKLLFLDSDILVSPDYLTELSTLHRDYGLIQATRRQLRQTAPLEGVLDYFDIVPGDTEPANEAWETFQSRVRPWDEMAYKWKFASTFCLSIKRDDFFRLGAFRRSFHKYGFEDTDLGFRAARAGLKFYRSRTPVYHFKHFPDRSEYRHRASVKRRLLSESARIFYLNNPEPEVVQALPGYLKKTPWRMPWL